jgi:CrcB protein
MGMVLGIALGGALGALLRYWVSSGVYTWLGRDFPYGTLVVNVAGSFAMGLLTVLLVERINAAPEWRAALLIGVLGAFTTFSTFSMETLALIEQGAMLRALANMLLSVGLCLGFVWLGVMLGRQL